MRAALLLTLTPLVAAQTDALADKSERAKMWMAQGRFTDAARLYEELTQAVPGNPGLLMNLGMARHMAGLDAQAIAPLEAAVKIKPLPPALLFLGASYLRSGQPAQAIAPLKRFAATQPEHRQARQMLIDAATAAANHSEAVIHLRKFAEWEPAKPGIWYGLGHAYQELAASLFAGIPPESGYWLALAADSRRQTQSRAAFLLYRKAMEKLPKMRGLHASVAAIYQSTNHLDWATSELKLEAALGAPNCKPAPTLECYFAASRHSQVLASPLKTLETLYWKIRSYDALSREAYARLLTLPPSAESHRFQAESHRAQGRHAEAAESWRAALALAPSDASLEFELASTLAQRRDFDGAQGILTGLLAHQPTATDLNFLQGELLLNQQKPAEAIPFLSKAAAKLLPARASLGRALSQSSRPSDAIPHLKAALSLDTDGGLHFQLARAYQSTGQAELAKQTLAAYQQIQKRVEAERQAIENEATITAPVP